MLPGHFSVGSPDEMRLFAHAVAAARVRRPQRQASITYSDEVPQVKVENRKTAAPFARERVRACQSVSVFYLHLFTRMPQNSDSQINRGEDFAKKPPHFAFSSGLFLRQSAVSQRFVPYHHKKMGNSINVCDRRNHCPVCYFRARVRSAPQCTALSFTAGCEAHFCRSVLDSAWQTARISTSKRGEAVVTALPHGRTRKREPKSTKPSHLSNYGSTLCVIRVKRRRKKTESSGRARVREGMGAPPSP